MSSNVSARSCLVADVITTVSGSATDCKRDAKLGVLPTTDMRSRVERARSPTTSVPVAMPARLQVQVARKRKLAHGRDEVERAPHRPFRIVLVRARKAELNHNAVAEELGDLTTVPRDDVAAKIVIGLHHRA